MAKKRYASGGITISMGGGQSSDGVFGEKANSGNQYPFPNGNAGDSPTATSDNSQGTSQTFNIQPHASSSPGNQDNSSPAKMFKRGGTVKSSASKRGDGIAQRGKTRGKYL
jgi:hypothetical protein